MPETQNLRISFNFHPTLFKTSEINFPVQFTSKINLGSFFQSYWSILDCPLRRLLPTITTNHITARCGFQRTRVRIEPEPDDVWNSSGQSRMILRHQFRLGVSESHRVSPIIAESSNRLRLRFYEPVWSLCTIL